MTTEHQLDEETRLRIPKLVAISNLAYAVGIRPVPDPTKNYTYRTTFRIDPPVRPDAVPQAERKRIICPHCGTPTVDHSLWGSCR